MPQPSQTTLLKLNTTELGQPYVVTAAPSFNLKLLNTLELGKIFSAPATVAFPTHRMFLLF